MEFPVGCVQEAETDLLCCLPTAWEGSKAGPIIYPHAPAGPHISRLWGNCLRWVGSDRLTPSISLESLLHSSPCAGSITALMLQDRPH